MTTPQDPIQPTPEQPTPQQPATWPGWWVILGAVIVLVVILAVVYLGDGETDDTTVTTVTNEETTVRRSHYRGCGDRGSDGDHGGRLARWPAEGRLAESDSSVVWVVVGLEALLVDDDLMVVPAEGDQIFGVCGSAL